MISTHLILHIEKVRKQELGCNKQNIKLNTSYTMSTFCTSLPCVPYISYSPLILIT